MRRRPTPGPGGYVVAVAVATAVTALGFLVIQFSTGDSEQSSGAVGFAFDLLLGGFFAGVYVMIFAVPLGALGALVVHLACRRVEPQWVHVVAAGVAGLVVGFAVARAIGSGIDGLSHLTALAWVVGGAAAAGRAVVIPWRPVDTSPVDDDFAPGRTAC